MNSAERVDDFSLTMLQRILYLSISPLDHEAVDGGGVRYARDRVISQIERRLYSAMTYVRQPRATTKHALHVS